MAKFHYLCLVLPNLAPYTAHVAAMNESSTSPAFLLNLIPTKKFRLLINVDS